MIWDGTLYFLLGVCAGAGAILFLVVEPLLLRWRKDLDKWADAEARARFNLLVAQSNDADAEKLVKTIEQIHRNDELPGDEWKRGDA